MPQLSGRWSVFPVVAILRHEAEIVPIATLTLYSRTVVIVAVLRHEAEIIREARLRIVEPGIPSTVPLTEGVDVIHISD